MAAKLLQFYEPEEREIDKYVECSMGNDYDQFTTDLVIARSMWRAHRAAVESEQFPEPFRTISIARNDGIDPQDETGCLGDWDRIVNSPELVRKAAIAQAKELVALTKKMGRGKALAELAFPKKKPTPEGA